MTGNGIAELIDRLAAEDPNDRMLAVGELVRLGSAAVPGLVAFLQDRAASGRALAAEALAEIADPGSADDLAALVEDPDGDVRGNAAVGLGRLGDPRAVAAFAATIDDREDVLRYPYTSSVYGLIALGEPALAAVAPLLTAPDPVTRERAFVVVRSVVEVMPDTGDWAKLWDRLGRYDPRAEASDAAADRWREWIAAR